MQFIDLTLQFCANMPFRKKWLGATKNRCLFNEMQTNYAQWKMKFIAPCAELWIPESGKLLLVTQNPAGLWNPESSGNR